MVKPILSRLCEKAACPFNCVGSDRLSNRKVACFIAFGAAAVTLAGYSAYAQRANRALADQSVANFIQPQTSNRAAKTSKLAVLASLEPVEDQTVYALASAMPDADLGRPANPAVSAAPTIPADEPVPPVSEAKPPAVAAATAPPEKRVEKPKKLAALPAAPAASNNVLDDGQINGLKGRLRLTSDQVEYWPAVESALRDVVRTQFRGSVKQAHAGKANIDVNSPEVQKLIWAAMPLLMRLREDQKSEVRKLARVIGLEQVAAQI
jgi:hypothetical protein